MSDAPGVHKLEFYVMQQEKDAECISLISQVMDFYHDKTTKSDQIAIAEWFLDRYGKGRKEPS